LRWWWCCLRKGMLRTDPIVQKYPQYLPTEDEVSLTLELLQKPEHKELKKALLEHIAIAGCLPSSLLRFCWQARQDKKYGAECAEGALGWLARCLAVRVKLNVDSLLDNGPFPEKWMEKYMSAMPISFHRTDKQGHPVMIQRLGNVDLEAFKELWLEGEELQARAGLAVNAVVLFHIRCMEYLTQVVMGAESRKQGRVVDRMLAVIDLEGVGLKHLNSPLKAFFSAVAQNSTPLFPEILHANLVANVPWIVAKAGWPIAKSFLHPVTQDKFCMLSSSAEFKAKLLELMAPEDIPPYFGGKCTCEECAGGALRGGSLWDFEQSRRRGEAAATLEAAAAAKVVQPPNGNDHSTGTSPMTQRRYTPPQSLESTPPRSRGGDTEKA